MLSFRKLFNRRPVHDSSTRTYWKEYTLVEASETVGEEECLHCEIMQVIGDYMETRTASGHQVNLPDVADCIVESLAQFLQDSVPLEERIAMIAYVLERFGQALRAEPSTGTRHLN